VTYKISINQFESLPNTNSTYFLEIGYRDEVIKRCFTISNIRTLSAGVYDKSLQNGEFSVLLSPPIEYSGEEGCLTCFSSNSVTCKVENCLTGEFDYVSIFNPEQYEDFGKYVIGYGDNLNQFCGVFIDISPSTSVQYNFINIYGPVDAGACETCLNVASDKIIIQDCFNSERVETVWGSQLYENGEISNLSLSSGCYSVVGLAEPEAPITIDNIFDYNPTPGCEPCAECFGQYYQFVVCDSIPPITSPTVFSYQYFEIGEIFYNPYNDQCCKVVGYGEAGVNYGTIYSTQTFGVGDEFCNTCYEENFEVRNIEMIIDTQYPNCNVGIGNGGKVITSVGVNIGDIVKIKRGENDYLCARVANVSTGSITNGIDFYNSKRDNSGNTITYNDCIDCLEQSSRIGISVINCDTNELSYVSLNLNDYITVSDINTGFPSRTFLTNDGRCLRALNDCPLPLTATTEVTPIEFYYNCSDCNSNYIPPRSANTETIVCVETCESGTFTQVTPPHPVWTDGYGTPVTQLNAITLGGPNGLNA